MDTVCNRDCFNCCHEDCVLDESNISTSERKYSNTLDKTAIVLQGLEYDPTRHRRQIPEVDPVLYRQAQNRHFHKKYYYENPDKYRRIARESYHNNREARLSTSKEYYKSHKEEISAQKKSYYEENKEEILLKRKLAYVPHPRQVINTVEAEKKRERSRLYYEKHKDEINRKRREKRRKELEECCLK